MEKQRVLRHNNNSTEKYGINPGDLYEVTISDVDELKITYKLIYKSK